MKSMKKTLSLILAAVMLFAVCSMSVSAAVPDGNVIALGLKTEKASYKAGEIVTFVVTLEETADFYAEYGGLSVGEFDIAYNSAIFEPIASLDDTDKLKDHGVTLLQVANGVDASNSAVTPADGVDAINDWDAGIHIGLAENLDSDLTDRYFDCSAGPVDTFKFQLKVKEGVVDGSYKVGHSKTGYDNMGVYVISGKENDESHGWYQYEEGTINCSPIYSFGTCDVVVSAAGGSGSEEEKPTETVKNLDAQVQWADKAAGTMNVGFRGEISGFDLAANKTTTVTDKDNGTYTKLNRLQEVGVIFTRAGGAEEKVTSEAIYDFKSGTYFYRVVVGNIPYDSQDALTAQAYIVVGGVTVKADGVINTTGAKEYARATGLATNPMPTK